MTMFVDVPFFNETHTDHNNEEEEQGPVRGGGGNPNTQQQSLSLQQENSSQQDVPPRSARQPLELCSCQFSTSACKEDNNSDGGGCESARGSKHNGACCSHEHHRPVTDANVSSSDGRTGKNHKEKCQKRQSSLANQQHPQHHDNHDNNDNEDANNPGSNEWLLGTAFVTFFSFAMTETVFAMIAGSEAMMGDAAAMLVDSATYGLNYLAERQKKLYLTTTTTADDDNATDDDDELHRQGFANSTTAEEERIQHWRTKRIQQEERNNRKHILRLETLPPFVSVSALILITAFVLQKAIATLVLDRHRDVALQAIPNLSLMIGFSCFNLVLDLVNIFCFARAKHLFGYAVKDHHIVHHEHEHDQVAKDERGAVDTVVKMDVESQNGIKPAAAKGLQKAAKKTRRVDSNSTLASYSSVLQEEDVEEETRESTIRAMKTIQPVPESLYTNDAGNHYYNNEDSDDDDDEEEVSANLNMCSAYTHVFADTLRSLAVIVASITAWLLPNLVTPEEADAAAAIVVSLLILLSLVPLFQGLTASLSELRAIRAEEEAEAISSVLQQEQDLKTAASEQQQLQ